MRKLTLLLTDVEIAIRDWKLFLQKDLRFDVRKVALTRYVLGRVYVRRMRRHKSSFFSHLN